MKLWRKKSNMIRFLNNITRTFQGILYVAGISIHNNFTDECVSDFSCCCKAIKNPFNKRFKYFVGDMKRIWRI